VVGVDLEAALAALSTATVSGMRMEILTTPSGATIVNDAYNANPTSMIAALDALAAMDADRRIAVIGLMAEIDDAEVAHREVAAHARERELELVAVGTSAYGIEPFDDPVAAIGRLGPRDVVLVKASRSAGLERVVARLTGQ
jgi:UDP-N-acetylmuramoyl-tripeptide--D-alanyl-D-alanine ligase